MIKRTDDLADRTTDPLHAAGSFISAAVVWELGVITPCDNPALVTPGTTSEPINPAPSRRAPALGVARPGVTVGVMDAAIWRVSSVKVRRILA